MEIWVNQPMGPIQRLGQAQIHNEKEFVNIVENQNTLKTLVGKSTENQWIENREKIDLKVIKHQ